MSRAAPVAARAVPERPASRKAPAPRPRQALAKVEPRPAWPVLAGITAALVGGVVLTAWAMDLPRLARDAAASALGSAGYAVRTVDIRGLQNTPRNDVMRAAIAGADTSAFALDLAAIRARVEALPWVRSATVARRLPDTLVIEVVERTPFALWQRQGRLAVIDASGKVLTNRGLERFSALPMVVGEDAARHAPSVFAMLEQAPVLKAQLDSVRWVGNRRWDVRFKSGEVLMLPEGERQAASAVRAFAELEAGNGLLGKGFERFDLRLTDRMVVRKMKQGDMQRDPAARPRAGVQPDGNTDTGGRRPAPQGPALPIPATRI